MRVTGKLFLAFLLGIIILTVINGTLAVRREQFIFEQEARAESERVGRTIHQFFDRYSREWGPEATLQFASKTAFRDDQVEVRVVSLGDLARERERVASILASDQVYSEVVENRKFGETRHVTYWPVQTFSGARFAAIFDRSMAHLSQKKNEMIVYALVQSAATAVVSLALTLIAGLKLVGEPLKELTRMTDRIANGDLKTPVQIQSKDELGQLGNSLNEMCRQLEHSQEQVATETNARIAAMEQLRHADRLRTVGRLAAGLAHELGTPLNVVSGRAALIESGRLDDEGVKLSAETIRRESERMTGIIRQLLDFSRRSSTQKTNVCLKEVADHVLQLLQPIAKEKQVELRFEDHSGEADCSARANESQVQQVLTNLVQNGIQAVEENGVVEIDLQTVMRTHPNDDSPENAGEFHCLSVVDDGEGIRPEDREHLFEPFFTTKDVGEGTGLGLSVVYSIVEEHGGWIEVDSRQGEGSCFRVFLPLA